MDTKKFYASKTFWFNAVAVVLYVVPQLLGNFGYDGAMSPEIEGYISIFLPAAVALINIVLRFVTKQPVEL